MEYIKLLKRLFEHPKKYTLYRTAKLRYVLLHLLLLSIMLVSISLISYSKSFNAVDDVVTHHREEIPEFQIINDHLTLEGAHQPFKSGNTSFIFTESQLKPKKNYIIFDKDELMISDATTLTYQSMGAFNNKQELVDKLKIFTNSKLFFLGLLGAALIIIQYTALLIKVMLITTLIYIAARLFNKKIRYMNQLKATVFLITIPEIILFLTFTGPDTLLVTLSWCIIAILACLTIYYLPGNKKRHVSS